MAPVSPCSLQPFDEYCLVLNLPDAQQRTGYVGPLHFEGGVYPHPVPGHRIRSHGVLTAVHCFPWRDDHRIVWRDGVASYEPIEIPQPTPAPKPRSATGRCRGRTKTGEPCGRRPLRGREYCAHHQGPR